MSVGVTGRVDVTTDIDRHAGHAGQTRRRVATAPAAACELPSVKLLLPQGAVRRGVDLRKEGALIETVPAACNAPSGATANPEMRIMTGSP